MDRIEYRVMAEQSIAKTFKGILRVANVQEATDKDEDVYFNPIYYGTPTKGIASESTGYDSAYNVLSGSLLRYTFPGDDYKNAKAPVTDSLGNYMNINVGADSVTFGSDELNNGNDASTTKFTQLLYSKQFDQEKIFPVIQAKNAIVGLKARVNPESKTSINGGSVTIDASPYYDSVDAKLIVNNNYDHTPKNINDDDKSYKKISDQENEKKRRTIYQVTNNNLQDYDALVHYQDNIDIDNYTKNNTIDSIVDVVNLKDYVKEKLEQYLHGNVVEIPTGTIINQYISLNKWYCIGTNSASGNLGNNPPMGVIQDTDNYSPTLYQGVVRKGINRILALSDDEDMSNSRKSKQLKEIIPLYKRDYTLCDGSIFTIHMLFPELSNNYDYPSYEQFINLFFCIGYQYTDYANIRPHYINAIKSGTGNNRIWGWKDNIRTVANLANLKMDKDVLFSLDLLSMLAIKAIYNEMKTGVDDNGKSACLNHDTNMFDREKATNWLKKQKLPKQFIFNSMVPSKNGGMQYEYKVGTELLDSPPTYNFDIGLEVNSFDSDIWYYDHTTTKTVTIPRHRGPTGHYIPERVIQEAGDYVKCKVWQTAEIQAVLDMFEKVNIAREHDLKNYYTFTFQVPNFVQTINGEDTDEKGYSTGAFIGFSPFIWSEDFKAETGLESVSSCSTTSYPHRHVICRGPAQFTEVIHNKTNTGTLTATSMTRAEGPQRWVDTWDVNYNNMWRLAGRDYYDDSVNVDAYCLAEVAGTVYKSEIRDGMAVNVIQIDKVTGPDQKDPRWKDAEPNRGLTSPPIDMGIIDEKFRSASANTADGEVKWFAPESVQMVPLIKL